MPRFRTATPEEIEAAAKRFKVCQRTIYRWLEAGLKAHELTDLEAVGSHILRQRNPSRATLETLTTELEHE